MTALLNSEWLPLWLGACWCLCHLSGYVAIKRRINSEFLVFQYHFQSFFASVLAVVILVAVEWVGITVGAGIIALHIIYSISFLEIWSFSQGSYSSQIIRNIAKNPGITAQQAIALMSHIGNSKRLERVVALQRLRLIKDQEEISLTPAGRCVSNFILGICWLANWKDRG